MDQPEILPKSKIRVILAVIPLDGASLTMCMAFEKWAKEDPAIPRGTWETMAPFAQVKAHLDHLRKAIGEGRYNTSRRADNPHTFKEQNVLVAPLPNYGACGFLIRLFDQELARAFTSLPIRTFVKTRGILGPFGMRVYVGTWVVPDVLIEAGVDILRAKEVSHEFIVPLWIGKNVERPNHQFWHEAIHPGTNVHFTKRKTKEG